MNQLETIDRNNWEDFMQAPATVLMIGKTDCPACQVWGEELNTFLQEDEAWNHVRFGKVLLDQPGLIGFKRANPWLSDVKDLPFTVVYKDGENKKSFAGGGLNRLLKRMEKALS